jgi:hypothetical protein
VTIAIVILTLVLVGLVVLVVGAPLRAARRQRSGAGHGPASAGAEGERSGQPLDPRLDELRAAREAKYREIRDAELDFRTGKLSREDYEAIDAQLRAEAIAILDQLEPADAGCGELRPRDA